MVDTVWKAAAYGDLPCLRALLAKEPKLAEARDEAGFSPLQWAALNDRVEVVDALLALRVDPNRCATARLVVSHALCEAFMSLFSVTRLSSMRFLIRAFRLCTACFSSSSFVASCHATLQHIHTSAFRPT